MVGKSRFSRDRLSTLASNIHKEFEAGDRRAWRWTVLPHATFLVSMFEHFRVEKSSVWRTAVCLAPGYANPTDPLSLSYTHAVNKTLSFVDENTRFHDLYTVSAVFMDTK